MALADYTSFEPQLTKKDRAALRWAAQKADEWYGNVTGNEAAENHHLKMMKDVRSALIKLRIHISIRG